MRAVLKSLHSTDIADVENYSGNTCQEAGEKVSLLGQWSLKAISKTRNKQFCVSKVTCTALIRTLRYYSWRIDTTASRSRLRPNYTSNANDDAHSIQCLFSRTVAR